MKKIAIVLLLSITLTGFLTALDFSRPAPTHVTKAADLADEVATLHSCKPKAVADFGIAGQTFKSVDISLDGQTITIKYESGKNFVFTYKEVAYKISSGTPPRAGEPAPPGPPVPMWWIYETQVGTATRYMATLNTTPSSANGFIKILFVEIFDSYSPSDPDGLGPFTDTSDADFNTLAARFNGPMTDGPKFECKQAFAEGNITGWNISKGAANDPPVITIEPSAAMGRPELKFTFDLMAFIDGWDRVDNNYFYFKEKEADKSDYSLYAVRLNMAGKSGHVVQMIDSSDLGKPLVDFVVSDTQATQVYLKLIQWVYNDMNGDACSKMVGPVDVNPPANAEKSTWATNNTPPQKCISLNGTDAVTDKANYSELKPISWMARWGIHVQIGGLVSGSPDEDTTPNACGKVATYSLNINARMRVAFCNMALGLHELATNFTQGAINLFNKIVGLTGSQEY